MNQGKPLGIGSRPLSPEDLLSSCGGGLPRFRRTSFESSRVEDVGCPSETLFHETSEERENDVSRRFKLCPERRSTSYVSNCVQREGVEAMSQIMSKKRRDPVLPVSCPRDSWPRGAASWDGWSGDVDVDQSWVKGEVSEGETFEGTSVSIV